MTIDPPLRPGPAGPAQQHARGPAGDPHARHADRGARTDCRPRPDSAVSDPSSERGERPPARPRGRGHPQRGRLGALRRPGVDAEQQRPPGRGRRHGRLQRAHRTRRPGRHRALDGGPRDHRDRDDRRRADPDRRDLRLLAARVGRPRRRPGRSGTGGQVGAGARTTAPSAADRRPPAGATGRTSSPTSSAPTPGRSRARCGPRGDEGVDRTVGEPNTMPLGGDKPHDTGRDNPL